LNAAIGLRERKKRKTREAIQREAMRLFQERGYDRTTIEDIAEAAEISPSTFFNYFPTKEDVVLYDRYDPILIQLLGEGPPGERPSAALRRGLAGLAGLFREDRDVILARANLGLKVPAVRARLWEELERAQLTLCQVLAARAGRDPDDFELRVVAMTVVTAAFVAMVEWVRGDGRGDIADLVGRALDVVDAGARLDAIGPSEEPAR
jgi:AcrR family transcriptional regulator